MPSRPTTERTGSSSRPVVRAVSTLASDPNTISPTRSSAPACGRASVTSSSCCVRDSDPIERDRSRVNRTVLCRWGRLSTGWASARSASPTPTIRNASTHRRRRRPTVHLPRTAMYQMPASPSATAQSNPGAPKLTGVPSPAAWTPASAVPAPGAGRRGVPSGPPTTRSSSERPPARPPTGPTPGWWRSSHR